jgi:uncharacterized membrane protein YcaP (DUF421 family)
MHGGSVIMEHLAEVDWGQLFSFSLPVAEIVIRGSAMYWFLFLVFRFAVRRELGGIGVGDILIMVIVADASQNAMAGEYKSISDGFLLVGTLIGWNVLLDWLSFRYPALRSFAKPASLLMIENGRLLTQNMRREFISEDELWGKLREAGVESLDQVRKAYVESDGQISVIKRGK